MRGAGELDRQQLWQRSQERPSTASRQQPADNVRFEDLDIYIVSTLSVNMQVSNVCDAALLHSRQMGWSQTLSCVSISAWSKPERIASIVGLSVIVCEHCHDSKCYSASLSPRHITSASGVNSCLCL